MAGMPRRSSVDLPMDLVPDNCKALRLKSNSEIYWDRLSLAVAEPLSAIQKHQCELLNSTVVDSGFAERTNDPFRRPRYDYGKRAPVWDTRHPAGFYTNFGPMLPLIQNVDDAVAIIGPGEEVQFEFADDLPDLPTGWTRRYVLEANGWCKDMDLFTENGGTLGPLPKRDANEDGAGNSRRDELHQEFNQRYMSW